MEKKVYITEEEREKCLKVIDAFAELYEIEDEDILLVDAVLYDEIFDNLPKEKQSELIGRKVDFAKKAGINP